MPRKRRTGKPPVYDRGAPPDVWGYTVAPTPALPLPPLPTPPPMHPHANDAPEAPPESLVANGPPPDDARGAQAWGFRALMLQAHEAMIDVKISSATRRKEVRVILAAAAKLYPDAARAEVANTIDEDRRQLMERKRANARAKLEARPPAGAAKVIPIRRDG